MISISRRREREGKREKERKLWINWASAGTNHSTTTISWRPNGPYNLQQPLTAFFHPPQFPSYNSVTYQAKYQSYDSSSLKYNPSHPRTNLKGWLQRTSGWCVFVSHFPILGGSCFRFSDQRDLRHLHLDWWGYYHLDYHFWKQTWEVVHQRLLIYLSPRRRWSPRHPDLDLKARHSNERRWVCMDWYPRWNVKRKRLTLEVLKTFSSSCLLGRFSRPCAPCPVWNTSKAIYKTQRPTQRHQS